MSNLMSSRSWCDYFVANDASLMPIPWQRGAEVSADELNAIARSLQAWQLGETSDGAHLRAAAAKYAAVHDDPDFSDAVEYFIREEQRHGECLGRFLDLAGAGRIRRNWGDTMFRLFRYTFTNLEIWATVVIMVETLALVYYNAIRHATRSTVLRTICKQILKDEVPHIRFQYERLAIHAAMRPRWQRRIIRWVHRLLFTGIVTAVWVDHCRALQAGGHTFVSYWSISWRKMTYAWNQLDEACEHVRGGCQDSNVQSATTRQTRLFAPPVLDS